MLGSFAEFERAVINERTRNGRIARLNDNKWVGGKPSLGYKVNKHGQFEIDEKEAKIVKDIFKLRSKGLSLANIGVSKQKVDYILKNKNYIGVFEYQGKKEKNDITIEIESIVSKYMWNKVNNN
ncbi:MAG: recombinase family protein [Paraclostridium sp.]